MTHFAPRSARRRADRGTVRAAVPEDVDHIRHVLEEAFAPFLSRYTPAARALVVPSIDVIRHRLDEGEVWVYEIGSVQGTVSAAVRGDGCYLRSMAVHPQARRLGIGGALVETVVRWADSRGAGSVRLHTTPFLDAAISLYRKHGFRFASEADSSLEGTPLIAMEKSVR